MNLFADSQAFPVNELLNFGSAFVALATAVFAWWAHRKGTAASVANSTAIQAIHDVAVADNPTTAQVAAATKAVSELPGNK